MKEGTAPGLTAIAWVHSIEVETPFSFFIGLKCI
jgi:hypothetical protein